MAEDRSDYEVGYGRPPKATRFKAGRSGNPKGRPKKARSVKTEVLEVLQMPVAIGSGGKRKTISTLRAALIRLREKALNGDLRALKEMLALGIQYAPEEVADEASEALSEQEQAMIASFLERHGAATSAQPELTEQEQNNEL